MGGQHRSGGRLHRRIVRQRAGQRGVADEEVSFGRAEVRGLRRTRKPLPHPEDSLGVPGGAGEVADTRGHGTHKPRWAGRCPCPPDQADVFRKTARAEQVPWPGQVSWRKSRLVITVHRPDSGSPGQRFGTGRDLFPETAPAVSDPQRGAGRGRGQVPHEGLGIAAGRGQYRHDVAGRCPLYVVTGAAMVPEQPARLGRQLSGGPRQHRRVRAEQHIAPRGDAGQDAFQRARVAPVVGHDQLRRAIQRAPRRQPPRRLPPEPGVPAGQRQARAHPQWAAGRGTIAAHQVTILALGEKPSPHHPVPYLKEADQRTETVGAHSRRGLWRSGHAGPAACGTSAWARPLAAVCPEKPE